MTAPASGALPPARILDVDPDEYHRLPGLSSSIASVLLARSPLHAWHLHPMLGGQRGGEEPTAAMDFGSVAHAIVLGRGKRFAPVPFADWRTKAAQQTRDAYRAAGLVPLLTEQLERAQDAATAATTRLAELGVTLDGQSELPVEWYERSASGPVQCRGMLDHAWIEDGRVLDLKFVEDASPEVVERSAERLGYALQAAAYSSAVAALDPRWADRVEYMLVFVESAPPHAVNVSVPSGAFRELGRRRWRRAVNVWGRCLASGQWPAYGDRNFIGAPTWALAKEGVEND